jgi:hypothetical protein
LTRWCDAMTHERGDGMSGCRRAAARSPSHDLVLPDLPSPLWLFQKQCSNPCRLISVRHCRPSPICCQVRLIFWTSHCRPRSHLRRLWCRLPWRSKQHPHLFARAKVQLSGFSRGVRTHQEIDAPSRPVPTATYELCGMARVVCYP